MSGWNTDYKDKDGWKVTKVPHDQLGQTNDKGGKLLANIAALLPEPKKADSSAHDELDLVDAAARVGAAAAGARLARLQNAGQAEDEQFDRTIRDLKLGQRVTDPRKPKAKRTGPPEQAETGNLELEEQIAKHEAEEASVDAWLDSLQNEDAEGNEAGMSDDAYGEWLAANRGEAA